MKTPSRTWPRALGALVITGMLVTVGAGPVDAACADLPFYGEICTFTGNFCPKNFLPADGRLLPISQNQALYSLLGTNFGGDGVTTFALPDLRGATVMGTGQGANLPNVIVGQTGGGATTATVLAGSDVQVPETQLPFVGLTQCIANFGVFPSQN